ncbi:MAG: pilus assembly protein PilM [Chloroflexota bacterium]|nr:pilus assembly protein PilM [Chloroflexota bacterium]
MKLSGSRTAIAFTIESMSLRMLSFRGNTIESWYNIPLSSNLAREGVISIPKGIASIMADTIQQNNLSKKSVVAAVPSTGSITQTLNLPNVKKRNMQEIVQREVKRAMPSTHDNDLIYWQQLPGDAIQKQRNQVYTLAVPRNTITSVVEACHTAGLSIIGIELKPFALTRAVNCTNGIIVHGDVDNIEIVIVDNGFPALFRSIPVRDITPNADAASENLIRELPFTIDYFNRTYHDSQLTIDTAIYFSGELSLNPDIETQLAALTGREVIKSQTSLDCPPEFPQSQFLTTLGLMLRGKW